MGGQVSTLGDIHSYGILLLEMFLGKRPIDEMFKDGLSIHKFTTMVLPEHVMDIVDPSMFFEENEENASDDKGQIDSRGYRRTARVSEPAWEMREGFPEGKHFPDGGRSQTKDCEMGRTLYSRI